VVELQLCIHERIVNPHVSFDCCFVNFWIDVAHDFFCLPQLTSIDTMAIAMQMHVIIIPNPIAASAGKVVVSMCMLFKI
jgi:hypothetical protein